MGIKSGFTREDMKQIIREGLGVYKTDEIDLGYNLSTHCYRMYFKRWDVALYTPSQQATSTATTQPMSPASSS